MEVPHEILLNILSRVPVRSVFRFKCVSKEWHSFLTSSKMFRNMHIDHHQNNLKLLVLSKTKTSFEFTTIDCEAPSSDKDLTPTRRPLPEFEGITPRSICILASFHGLVCLGIEEIDLLRSSHLILWNPLTNEYKRLPKTNSYKECHNTYSKFGLYYSSREDDYKLLFVNYLDDNVYIYSLKSDSWREVGVFQHRILVDGHWNQGTYLNENIYFLQHAEGGLCSFIRFDTKTELFSKIGTTDVDDGLETYDYFATIMVISDSIHVCEKYVIEISDSGRACFNLNKLDKHENSTEVVYYQLKQDDDIMPYVRPFHLMKNGNWLMINHRSKEHCIYEVDLQEKKHIDKSGKVKGNICDDYKVFESVRVDDIHLRFANHVGYTETFVSPNQYMK